MEKYKILIYGCGDLGKKFFARLSDKYTIAGFIDEKAEMLREVNNAYEIFSLKQAACIGSKNEYIVIVALHDGMQHDIVAAKLYKMGYDKIIYSPMKLTISYSYRQQMKNIYRSALNGTIISMEKVLQQRKFQYGCEKYPLEKIIDMKKMRLDNIYPTTYHLLHSDKRFRKTRKNARCHSSSAALFSKLLLNRVESRKVFNMSKLRLIHSFSMVYYTPHSDKWLKN